MIKGSTRAPDDTTYLDKRIRSLNNRLRAVEGSQSPDGTTLGEARVLALEERIEGLEGRLDALMHRMQGHIMHLKGEIKRLKGEDA